MSRQTFADRVDEAYAALAKGRPTAQVVADLADKWGIARRTARRDVARAYAQLRADVSDSIPDKTDLLAQLISIAQGVAERSAANGADHLTLGAVNTVARLTGLDPVHRNINPTRRQQAGQISRGEPRP